MRSATLDAHKWLFAGWFGFVLLMFTAGFKMHAEGGETRPSTDGPSAKPPAICPTTRGIFSRSKGCPPADQEQD